MFRFIILSPPCLYRLSASWAAPWLAIVCQSVQTAPTVHVAAMPHLEAAALFRQVASSRALSLPELRSIRVLAPQARPRH